MSRVLITGGGGFTGHHMAAELIAHGYEPVGLFSTDREPIPPAFSDAFVSNLLDPERLQQAVQSARPDRVIHLAAQAFVAHGDAEEVYRTNIVGTRNLLEALARLSNPPSMTLLASSANVYGNSPAEVLDESTTPAPANDYAVSKLAMEYMSRLYAGRLPIVLTRPFNYTGVGQSLQFLIPKIVDHARRRQPEIELGNLEIARDFSDVRMLVLAYRRLLETPSAAGGVFNICSGVAYTLREVIGLVQELSGHEMKVRVNPAFVRPNEVRILKGTRARLEGLVGALDDIPLRSTLQWMLGAP